MKNYTNTADIKGFSLVELSIVLVILGLLVGGVLSGQSLIRASELRSVNTEYQKYATAIGTFRDKYFAIPGDFNNASGLGWGSYNGDSDGAVELSTTAGANENSTFWIHLSSAGMIEGSYTNIAAASTSVCNAAMTPGTNNPKAKIAFGGWNALEVPTYSDSGTTSVVYYNGSYGNALILGGGTTCGRDTAMTGIVKAEEAWNIDTKIDDGKPNLGSMVVFESQGSATAGCGDAAANATDATGVNYDLANPSKTACAMIFKSGY